MNSFRKYIQRLLDTVDRFLDGLTSYKLVLYFLIVLLGWATVVSLGGHFIFHYYDIILSTLLLVVVCRASGELFSRILNIARGSDSDYITALILALIMSPATNSRGMAILAAAGVAAIASKYILTIGRRHIFNPAAAGAFLCGALFHHYASWWVGTQSLALPALIGGLLIMRKMHRFWMIAIFALVYGVFLHQQFDGASPIHTIWIAASRTAVMFFAFVMLTEPLTSSDRLKNYIFYSVLVGVLFGYHKLGLSPEQALLIGNGLAFLLEPWQRLELKLQAIKKEAAGLYSFIFTQPSKFAYAAGQYMEWTMPLRQTDSRGNRRYLTLSSSPTEEHLAFTVKIPDKPSHFKQVLAAMKSGESILASHLSGSFTLPSDSSKKLVLIGGGVGITPFRSMAKFLLDSRQKCDINLLYFAASADEFAFKDDFARAAQVGFKTNYVDTSKYPLSPSLLSEAVPDYNERVFYISGPYGFVKNARQSLISLGVSATAIKSDYFPGYGG